MTINIIQHRPSSLCLHPYNPSCESSLLQPLVCSLARHSSVILGVVPDPVSLGADTVPPHALSPCRLTERVLHIPIP